MRYCIVSIVVCEAAFSRACHKRRWATDFAYGIFCYNRTQSKWDKISSLWNISHPVSLTVTCVLFATSLTQIVGREGRMRLRYDSVANKLPTNRFAQDRSLIRRLRCGLLPEGPPARTGAVITSVEKEPIGVVTSGCSSPCLGRNIAIGFVDKPFNKKGTEILVQTRKKYHRALTAPMPFVPTSYYKL